MLSTSPPSPTQPSTPPFPSFADGPPAPERGRAVALASVVALLGLAALLVGLGPYLTAHTSAGVVTVSGYALPQGMTVVAALLLAGLVAGLSTLPRIAHVRGATPVLHAIATAASTTGVLLAVFLLIVVGNVTTPADLIGSAADGTESVVIGLGWAGVTVLALAATQAVVAFVALAYDVGLAQARRTPEPAHEPFLPPEPTPPADAAPTAVLARTEVPSEAAETTPLPSQAAPTTTGSEPKAEGT
ncbi:DUF5336 domain-containing protein [Rhodococcus sp. NPDC003318]|uniref:DUF5336 domain-containing protein n=1 Tax=Rhodococcus sp. NPDC003318 TaxID=3364503 RepID=UPI00368F4530